jgi:Holliday junction resolvasome RuvABC endonuclease subunit
MVNVLGVDPGYRNLGLCILEINPRGGSARRLWSKSISVGTPNNGLAFVKFLWPVLEDLHKEYNIQGVATETPPFIKARPKISGLLWGIGTIIAVWAYLKGIPFRHAMPLTLKRACCAIVGRPYEQKDIPRKSEIKIAIAKVLGDTGKTSHENDALLAALLLYTDLIPDATART